MSIARKCTVEDCNKPLRSKYHCAMHHNRLQRGNSLNTRNYMHGMTNHPLYRSWLAMHNRCRNKNASWYHLYGGRGITVCDEWKDFSIFIRDMGERPKGMSLDRIDVNGNYEPSNCRWATPKVQSRNRRVSRSNTSGIMGVSYDKRSKKWQSYISVDYRRIPLGVFNNIEDAVSARKDAEVKYWS